jgi:hypothetical protein
MTMGKVCGIVGWMTFSIAVVDEKGVIHPTML